MGRKRICKGCGQELISLQSATMQEDRTLLLGEITHGFHRNLGACKETLLNKTKSNRKKVSK
jgi:hypothetical protein